MKWRSGENASHFTFFWREKNQLSRGGEREEEKGIFKSVTQNIAEGAGAKRRWQKQIHLKSFVIKSKLTFRTKLCYPPNLHFALTNTESNERDKKEEKAKRIPPYAHYRSG